MDSLTTQCQLLGSLPISYDVLEKWCLAAIHVKEGRR
jgi:hypothetical protein